MGLIELFSIFRRPNKDDISTRKEFIEHIREDLNTMKEY